MKTFDEMQLSWSLNKKQSDKPITLNDEQVKQIITPRISKERNRIFGYFWTSYFWQLIVYTSLSHLLIRFWNDEQIVLISLIGIILYLPFTIVFIKKYSRMALQKNSHSAESMYDSMHKQYVLLEEFFQFKKRFDWVGIPITCFVMVVVVFHLWVPNGWMQNLTGASITYAFALIAFVIATAYENKKSFKQPMASLQLLMNDLKQEW